MHRLYLLASLIPLAVAGACFSPDYGASGFACSAEDECPSGYECRSDGLCHRNGTPNAEPDASTNDAGPGAADADPTSPDADPDSPDADPGAVSNDLCGSAELLVDGVTTVGTLEAAASSDDYSCGGTSQNEVFYAFTLGESQKVSLTLGSVFDTTMVLLGSDCGSEIACASDAVLGEVLVEENLAAGTYFVAVESVAGASGEFTIQIDLEDPIVRPPNDDCDGIIELVDGVARVGDTASLGLSEVEPSCGANDAGDVVYEFTVPAGANRRAVVEITNAVGFDPAIMLTEGACPGTEVACGQNADGDRETLDVGDLAPGTYSVWVDADGVAPSTFDIRLDLLVAAPAPGNDTCAAPDALVENVVSAASTTGATDDNDLVCLAFDSGDTVHEFTLASDSALLVTLEPLTDWALAGSLREAASCDVAADIACSDGAFATRFINRPNQGAGDYNVLVDGVGGESGDYEIKYETRAADATFGYWMFETTETFVPLGAGANALAVANQDDEVTFELTLPFDFPFFGDAHSTATLHTNGFLSFDAVPTGINASNINNDCSMDATTPFNMIAPFWEDTVALTALGSSLKHETQGTAPHRRFVVEWANWNIFESSPCTGQCNTVGTSVTHQAILHENGDVEFRYGPRTTPSSTIGCGDQHLGCSATIGLRNSDGSDIDEAGCNSNTLVDNGSVIYFVHPF